jgi:hypothetical protein
VSQSVPLTEEMRSGLASGKGPFSSLIREFMPKPDSNKGDVAGYTYLTRWLPPASSLRNCRSNPDSMSTLIPTRESIMERAFAVLQSSAGFPRDRMQASSTCRQRSIRRHSIDSSSNDLGDS